MIPKEYPMKLTTLLLALATAGALVSATAFAQSPAIRHSQAASQTAAVAPGPGSISAADFVNNVVMRNMFDVQAARIAELKGDQSDKTFAQREISNHTKMTDDLKVMVNSKKINASIPTGLTSEYQQRIDRLQTLSGTQFDEAYGNEVLRNHENLNALLDQYAKNGDNGELKQWASNTVPEVRQQLAAAAKLK
jgi:putative membrane protein